MIIAILILADVLVLFFMARMGAARARVWAERALRLDPEDTLLRYNLACGMARAGERDFALDLLEESLAAGGRGHSLRSLSRPAAADIMSGRRRTTTSTPFASIHASR